MGLFGGRSPPNNPVFLPYEKKIEKDRKAPDQVPDWSKNGQ